ncbi:GntR family transcriptional regulator [Vibrio agarilyticus]|uniref:GntR family transcriptional regulator n=1 Tax=Vibrio agarilyticus TaxID=2726741 RepID=UPI0031B62D78
MIKYLDIYETIKQRIVDGYYSQKDKMPDGTALAKEFGCSELTIKKALDILVKDGLVVRKRGSGSFIKRPLSSLAPKHLYGTTANAQHSNQKIETKVLNYSVEPAGSHLADRLNCEEGDMLYYVIRVRIVDGVPHILEYTYMPINIVTGLSYKHVENSIYQYITDDLGLKIHSSTMEITIGAATELESKELHLGIGENIVNVEQIVYLDNGDIFEYSNSRSLCKNFKFSTNFVRS